ncbi:variable surface protein [Plasmodium gonderi]|uniref:Variable surface protein n=1 Tax=Plasmodium gonderi TaxID=77519 RepID=A0A1Y1JY19_PLAGO|nr:variable surface protein [Plasmodium gonderi]GAW84664.1 variable surface protein [Plasmodium gonderi]
MGKSIYEIVHHFPECRTKLDESPKQITPSSHPGIWEMLCILNANNSKLSHLKVHEREPKDICNQVMEYLGSVNSAKPTDIGLKESGCEYLYYWLYELLHHKYNTFLTVRVDEVYNELLSLFTNRLKIIHGSQINIYKCLEDPIKKIDFPKIRDIYDMYNKIIKHLSSNDDIFKDVVDMMKKHNNQLETLYDKISKTPTSTPYQRNITAPIMITILGTLLICIFIFVLLKFSECGLLIRRAIAWKRKLWDNIGEERNIYQDPEISNSLLRDSRYNISYNYP